MRRSPVLGGGVTVVAGRATVATTVVLRQRPRRLVARRVRRSARWRRARAHQIGELSGPPLGGSDVAEGDPRVAEDRIDFDLAAESLDEPPNRRDHVVVAPLDFG